MIGEPVTQENEISMIGKPEPERSATAYSNGAEVKLSRAFHVLAEDQGIAYRATVVVDDQGVTRAVSVNDLTVGRSPLEVLRTIPALQSGGLCGVGWRPGEAFVG